jgi:hypothetical protein
MQIVNGYVCQTCCDVAAAKAGKDPAHPNAPPGSTDKSSGAAKPGQTSAAVTFGGALAGPNGPGAANPSTPPAYSGGLLNVSA